MALIVEDGTGLATAEAYASVAAADAYWLVRGGAPAAWADTAATGSFHLEAQPSDTETVTIDSKTYTFQTTLTDVDGNVAIGASLADTQANLVGAINLSGDPADGRYADSMAAHTTVTATAFASNIMVVTAVTAGTAGNALVTTEACATDDNYWEDATLTGGADDKEQFLRLGAEWLDLEFGPLWRGRRNESTQALDWPRYQADDDDDFLFDSDALPTSLVRANIEAAARVATATGNELMPDDTTGGAAISRKRVKAGPVEQDITYAGGGASSASTTTYAKVEALVRELVHPAGRIRRA